MADRVREADGMETVSTAVASSPAPGMYGCEVGPRGPQQDMYAIDTLVGAVRDRRAAPAEFIGGDGEMGLGGMAMPSEDEFGERIGY